MILLTGASGYLGRQVLAKLQDRDLPYMATSRSGVVGTACDLEDRDDTEALFDRVKPLIVIHCAAVVPKSPQEYHDSAACEASQLMMHRVLHAATCPVVFASSQVIGTESKYAIGKFIAERWLYMREKTGDVSLRLPGLFGLPRRGGVIYAAAKAMSGLEEADLHFGPYPAMHVEDAAEYLVRAAIRDSDGNPEPYTVTYGNPRLVATYGPLDHTFESRVQALVEQVRG